MPASSSQKPVKSRQKRGQLTDSATATADVLASSNAILRPTRPGAGQRGLQQFFTPPVVSDFAHHVFGLNSFPVFDPTAGDGALLTSAPRDMRFGVEIDADHVAVGPYTAIRGDIQRVYPLMRAAGVTFPRILANPPFGLDDWSDRALSKGKKINSTLLTFRYCLGLLDPHGAGLFVAGRDRFNKLVLAGDELDAKSVVLAIDIDDLFDDVALPCTIALFTQTNNRSEIAFRRFSATAEELATKTFRDEIRVAFREGTNYVPAAPPSRAYDAKAQMETDFETIAEEYERRLATSDLTQDFDVMVKGGKLSIKPSPFAKIAVVQRGYDKLRQLEGLHGQSPAYFAINVRDWNLLNELARDEVLTIDPTALARIEKHIEKSRLQLRPMYPIPPQMRLGFLDDTERIQCTTTDADKGYRTGEWYDVTVDSKVSKETETRLHEQRNGKSELRRFEKEKKILRIRIGDQLFNESAEDIEYIIEHFELPEVGDLAADHPKELEVARTVLHEIAEENGFEWADFQQEDLARCVIKERALLTWSMGGGKTAGILGTAEAWVRTGRAKNRVLIIAPQDLHDQWRREAKKFLGTSDRQLESIETPADAERVRRHFKNGGEGWYLTSYEALSLKGTRGTELLPVQALAEVGTTDISDPDEPAISRLTATTEEACPSCKENGTPWSGTHCSTCGYTHYLTRVKNVASRLSVAFKDGVIAVDELSMVRGDTSLRSLALRGMRSRCRLGATGTPISNYVNDCFWGVAWTIGWGSPRFPYDYEAGKSKFEKDFCVIEYQMGSSESNEQHRRERRKVMPEVTNLSMLWKLLSINMVRRRQTDMGDMVERTFHPVEVPMGVNQLHMNTAWLKGFPSWFAEKNPDHPLVEHDLVEKFQATLGLLWKMEYAASLPEADPHVDWVRESGPRYIEKQPSGAQTQINPSNMTPKFVKALEIIEEHVANGEKVLVGSALVDAGPLVSRLLTARGIKAAHITDISADGKAKTKNPKKRAQAVTNFVQGDTDVLCAGVQAMKLGHNLDVASVVVLIGFPWSYEAFEQFLARVWRRTSKRPVSVYCLIAKGTIDERKFQLLSDKAAASDVALDGRLVEENEKPHDWNKYLREMKRAGIEAEGDELPEDQLAARWHDRPLPKLRSLYTNKRGKKSGIKPLRGVKSPIYKVSSAPGEQTAFFD